MYLDHWGLSRSPFDEAARELFVDAPPLELARTKLRYAIGQGQRAAALVGPAGVGKTALLQEFMRELEPEAWETVLLADPVGAPDEVLRRLAQPFGASGPDPVAALADALGTRAKAGRRVCLIIDDAHAISHPEVLEHLRMLQKAGDDAPAPLALLLCGQEPLVSALRQASRFDQRLALLLALRPLDGNGSKHYILSRLKVAGCERGIFTRSAAELIIRLAQGLPRDINRLCELCLTVGYGLGVEKIRRDTVADVARDLGFAHPSPNRPKRPGTTRVVQHQEDDQDPNETPTVETDGPAQVDSSTPDEETKRLRRGKTGRFEKALHESSDASDAPVNTKEGGDAMTAAPPSTEGTTSPRPHSGSFALRVTPADADDNDVLASLSPSPPSSPPDPSEDILANL